MKRTLLISLTAVSLAGVGLVAPTAASADVTSSISIGFENDTAGAVPNGFVSADSPSVAFYDTMGADLVVGELGTSSHGQAIRARPDDASAVEMRLAHPTTSLSLAFGNDDPGFSTTLDQAVLTVFRGNNQVGQTSVDLNANDVMDQRIAFNAGVLFNKARFQYVSQAGTPLNLIEVIDDIRIAPLCTVAGTEGNDILNGTGATDVICGGGGRDTISGNTGSDLIFAGNGSDVVTAGRGNDTVNGGPGNDRISGSRGADTLRGHAGRDSLNGGPGRDRCAGGPDRDSSISCESKSSIP